MKSGYGRLTQTKSGQEAKENTERAAWILEKFSFLKEHIARQISHHCVSVSTCFFSNCYIIYTCYMYVCMYVCMCVCVCMCVYMCVFMAES